VTTGQLLKAWREKADLTQEQFAEVGEISRSFLSDCEVDRSSPKIATVLRLIDAIERAWAPFPKKENERLARFFLGPDEEEALSAAGDALARAQQIVRRARKGR
jgi:transcriptional regulator with XRE-family HTH domain